MDFKEMLNQPLPSAQNRTYSEGVDDNFGDDYNVLTEGMDEGCSDNTSECGSMECGDDVNTLINSSLDTAPSFDNDRCFGLDCPTINQPESNDPIDAVNSPIPSVDDNPPSELTPDQSQRVDDTINAVATPILISSELSEDEMKEFTESVDIDIAVGEGFLTERTIIKFDKNAKKAQLYEVAVAACAREHNDRLYRKLETVYKMERVIKAKLRKKYHSQAQRKVKEYLDRAKKSKSGVLSRIARKLTGKG